MKTLKDQVIIVTGGAAGIGGGITTELSERGACVVAGQIPLSRFGDPQKDIAPVVAFLLGEDSKYMTGQTLMANGGDIKLR